LKYDIKLEPTDYLIKNDMGELRYSGVERDTVQVDETKKENKKFNFFQQANSTKMQPNYDRKASQTLRNKHYLNVMPMTNF